MKAARATLTAKIKLICHYHNKALRLGQHLLISIRVEEGLTEGLVKFSIKCVERVRNGDAMQLKRKLYKYQNVGSNLMFQSLDTN